ncbi:MAG: HIT domain-containing protein [Actinomycetota bacterium]|nr:HIT domain-containing protein [Actinomycetota bacterium]
MERLWAPWRMSYIGGPRPGGCVFCAQLAQSDEDALIVHRGELCYAVLNLYPYGSGHLMIVPFRHVAGPGDLDASERAEFWELLAQALQALEGALGAQGHNVGFNLGAAAGAGIEDHLHLHVVPRWSGDVNFMPVLADVRVMPQHLSETRTALASAWPK